MDTLYLREKGGAQHWARELTKLGHEVVVLPAKSVTPNLLTLGACPQRAEHVYR